MVVGTKKKGKYPVERDGIIYDNPEKFYDFGTDVHGMGKFSHVKFATKKDTGAKYAAKMVYFGDDADDLRYAVREYDLLVTGKLNHDGMVKLHEAYLVRKYLILILDLVEGDTLLKGFCKRTTIKEDDVAHIIRQLCEILDHMHTNNIVHLDIRPTNIRWDGRSVKLLDYNSARHLQNKKAGAVVDIIGDTEFCGPEMLEFDKCLPSTDMWSVGVVAYILLSGISPFFHEEEKDVIYHVQTVTYEFDEDAFTNVSTEAKDFIKSLFIRIPENRLTAKTALQHKWLQNDLESKRKNIDRTSVKDTMSKTTERLLREEKEEYVEASWVFRTFEEEEYVSPDDESDEEDAVN